jgi:hypothetical protein
MKERQGGPSGAGTSTFEVQVTDSGSPVQKATAKVSITSIALYPDSLVAQILAASTFPEQVVEADRWVQAHPDLKGADLGKAVDQQPWDPSVKVFAAFPYVLGNMDKNLSKGQRLSLVFGTKRFRSLRCRRSSGHEGGCGSGMVRVCGCARSGRIMCGATTL